MAAAATSAWRQAGRHASSLTVSFPLTARTRATSPAAKMCGSDVRHWASTRTPSATASPARPASSSLGAIPMPTTTTSASMNAPPATSTPRTPPPLVAMAVGVVAQWTVTPCSRCRATSADATGAATLRPRTCGAASTTLTSWPKVRAAAATSRPMTPPPMTTSRLLRANRARQEASVLMVPEVQHALGRGSRDLEATRLGAGGDQQAVIGQLVPVAGGKGP